MSKQSETRDMRRYIEPFVILQLVRQGLSILELFRPSITDLWSRVNRRQAQLVVKGRQLYINASFSITALTTVCKHSARI
jgi:hypothetical protein